MAQQNLSQQEINHANWVNSLNLDMPQHGVLPMEQTIEARKAKARAAMRFFILNHKCNCGGADTTTINNNNSA